MYLMMLVVLNVVFFFFRDIRGIKISYLRENFIQMLFVKYGRKCIIVIPVAVHKLHNIMKVF